MATGLIVAKDECSCRESCLESHCVSDKDVFLVAAAAVSAGVSSQDVL